MRSAEVAELLRCPTSTVPRQARRAGLDHVIGNADAWSPGDVLAVMVLRALDGKATYAEGARKCGEALDAGYPPAYLVTRGGSENVVVIDDGDELQVQSTVAGILLQASDAGAPVQVVKLRPMVQKLEPWIRELARA